MPLPPMFLLLHTPNKCWVVSLEGEGVLINLLISGRFICTLKFHQSSPILRDSLLYKYVNNLQEHYHSRIF